MIINFEPQTHELTDRELDAVPYVVGMLRARIGKQNTIKNQEIQKKLESAGAWLSAARVRKVVHHIRVNNLVSKVCATGNGYFVAETPEEIDEFIQSLQQRINAIAEVLEAMKNQRDSQPFKQGTLWT